MLRRALCSLNQLTGSYQIATIMPKRKASDAAQASFVETPPPKRTRKAGSSSKSSEKAVNTTQVLDTSTNAAKEAPIASSAQGTASTLQFLDEDLPSEGEEEIQAALSRPPPINSDYLPLPWKGRLGYACLNTYLRFSNPPVFSSRTCRIASILENRHPLQNPHEPPHPTKNRPDKNEPADIRRGQAYVESLGLANARDIVKMLRWNDRYGIKFMRLSSEMFPFASHREYGYNLQFASEVLAEAGKVAAELGHRLTTHPGQYTQLGSPRKEVIENAIRDLVYHAEMLDLLQLPPQQDRDAVMILHLGGVFGDKEATLERFRENYRRLPDSVKKRLVLENDDVSWSVHDLLPVCEELKIPFVLDFHHHNIIFDADHIREGTKDIMGLFPRIITTWKRKNITPKMHYSEPTPAAITRRQRRKHSPRVSTLPPCPPDMDLMIEAKDKEQAVFELMRTFKLPGFNLFNDILPHVRNDDNKPPPRGKKGAEPEALVPIPEHDVGMGGPERRVYWPSGMEDWLRPVKRVVTKKEGSTPTKKTKVKALNDTAVNLEVDGERESHSAPIKAIKRTSSQKTRTLKKTVPKLESTPELTESEALSVLSNSPETPPPKPRRGRPPNKPATAKARPSRDHKRVSYVETEDNID